MKQVENMTSVKRSINYAEKNQMVFYKNAQIKEKDTSGKKPSDDIITILGSGAATLMATVSAATLLSLI